MVRHFPVKIGKPLNIIYIGLSQFNYIVYRTFSTTYIVN